jgi:BirA family biotin operon repressor/biotin-[acetyl-CoA-carboxylase] ligase
MDAYGIDVKTLTRAEELRRLINLFRVRDASLFQDPNPDTVERLRRRSDVLGQRVYYYEQVPRLMPLAREKIIRTDRKGTDLPSGCVWWADSLIQAKGRMERAWWAPPGGVYLCLAVYPSMFRRHWAFYNMGVGVAVAQVLREGGAPASIRWVNDILIDGRKVAGILTETVTAPVSRQTYLLIGLGLNVNIEGFPEYLPEATSLSIHTGRAWPTTELAARIISRAGWIFGLLHEWESEGLDLTAESMPSNPVIEAWNLLSDTPGRMLAYGHDAELTPEFVARAGGLAPDGSLRLVLEDRAEITVNSGEVRYLEPQAADTPQ